MKKHEHKKQGNTAEPVSYDHGTNSFSIHTTLRFETTCH